MPQLVFSLEADLLFPAKYITKVLNKEQEEAERQKKKKRTEDRQWVSDWYKRHQQQELPWYKTFFRGEGYKTGNGNFDAGTSSSSSSTWTIGKDDNMGTTALDYNALLREAKIVLSGGDKTQSPNYMPLPASSTYVYADDNYDPTAPPLSRDHIDVYGGMSQSLKDSCLPLIPSRKQPRDNNKEGFGRGWIKKKRHKTPRPSFSHQLAPLPTTTTGAYDDMPDLEAGIPLPGSNSKTRSGLRRRRRRTYRGYTYNK